MRDPRGSASGARKRSGGAVAFLLTNVDIVDAGTVAEDHLAPGRRADLVLLDANPLDGLATLRRPRAVIVGGRMLDRAAGRPAGTDALADER